MTLDEANVIADTWILDPDIWFRDLSAKLKLCINASMEPAGRYIKRQWCWDHQPFEHDAEAIEIIETIGLGNFSGSSPIPLHYWSYGARIRPADEAQPLPINPPIPDEPIAVAVGRRWSVPDFAVLARYRRQVGANERRSGASP